MILLIIIPCQCCQTRLLLFEVIYKFETKLTIAFKNTWISFMESILALKKKFRFSFPWRGSRGKHFPIDLINYYRALDVFSFWISWSEMKSCFVSTLRLPDESNFPNKKVGKWLGTRRNVHRKLLQHLHHWQSFENWQNLDRLIFWPFFRLKNISREEIGMNLLVFLCHQVLRWGAEEKSCQIILIMSIYDDNWLFV